jgi:hypothetical protein
MPRKQFKTEQIISKLREAGGAAHAHRGDQGYYTHSNPGRR